MWFLYVDGNLDEYQRFLRLGLFFPVQMSPLWATLTIIRENAGLQLQHATPTKPVKPFLKISYTLWLNDSNWQGSRIPNIPNLILLARILVTSISHFSSRDFMSHSLGLHWPCSSRHGPFSFSSRNHGLTLAHHLNGILSLAMGWRKSSLDSLELDNGNLRTGPHSNAEKTSSIRQTSQRSWWHEPQRWMEKNTDSDQNSS